MLVSLSNSHHWGLLCYLHSPPTTHRRQLNSFSSFFASFSSFSFFFFNFYFIFSSNPDLHYSAKHSCQLKVHECRFSTDPPSWTRIFFFFFLSFYFICVFFFYVYVFFFYPHCTIVLNTSKIFHIISSHLYYSFSKLVLRIDGGEIFGERLKNFLVWCLCFWRRQRLDFFSTVFEKEKIEKIIIIIS